MVIIVAAVGQPTTGIIPGMSTLLWLPLPAYSLVKLMARLKYTHPLSSTQPTSSAPLDTATNKDTAAPR